MLIRGDANNAGIELSEPDGLGNAGGSEFYRVTLRENGFEASIRVHGYDPMNNGLSKFFTSLADDWRGWDGIRKWCSLEGEFELRCEHDRVGHVTTLATIDSNSHGHGWRGQIRFDIPAGELKEIASGITRFFNTV